MNAEKHFKQLQCHLFVPYTFPDPHPIQTRFYVINVCKGRYPYTTSFKTSIHDVVSFFLVNQLEVEQSGLECVTRDYLEYVQSAYLLYTQSHILGCTQMST